VQRAKFLLGVTRVIVLKESISSSFYNMESQKQVLTTKQWTGLWTLTQLQSGTAKSATLPDVTWHGLSEVVMRGVDIMM